MAFSNSIAQYSPSQVVWIQRNNVVTNTGNTNVTFPTSGNFAPPITTGKIRVKTNMIGTNGTHRVFAITAIDASNANHSVQLYAGDTGVTANSTGIDQVYSFGPVDFQIGTINVAVNVNNNSGTHDCEIVGTE